MGARFQVLFHSPPGVLFTFPSRYLSTIGHRDVFRLGWWSTQLRTGFHVPGPTREEDDPARSGAPTGLSPCAAGRPWPFGSPPRAGAGAVAPACAPPQTRGRRGLRPWRRSPVWPWPPFARRYSGDLAVDFSSSGYLDVSVPRVAPSRPMCSAGRRRTSVRRVRPFGDPRIVGRVPLPADYRGLPRPSSAPCAKASAVRP